MIEDILVIIVPKLLFCDTNNNGFSCTVRQALDVTAFSSASHGTQDCSKDENDV
jgi:hypothetical protein